MLKDLLIHHHTKRQLDGFINSPSHALILTGPQGSGKQTLARALAASILGIDTSKLPSYPYFTEINPEEQTIPIETIRNLQKLLVLRTPDKEGQAIRRVINVIDAERMPHEAQNAFLKSLEEPPADTCLILTAVGNRGLLPTIYSRVQRIEVLPISKQAAEEFFTESGNISSSYALSQGQVGLLSALLTVDEHELKSWVETAKKLLSMPADERLLQVDNLSKEKQDIIMLLVALQRIAHAGLMYAGAKDKQALAKHWHTVMAKVQFALKATFMNANTKLLLDDVMLNL